MIRTKYCIANWKMNFNISDIEIFMKKWKNKNLNNIKIKTIFCPSFTELFYMSEILKDSTSELGAQNVFYESNGAFTGEISCSMLKETGCEWVIIGHSERRNIIGETDEMINYKLLKIISEDLTPILCVGETIDERNAGQTNCVLNDQIINACNNMDINKEIVIAYEPVWAIGTGLSATEKMISKTHDYIRYVLDSIGINGKAISLLYGGSVSQENAKALSNIEGIDGFLLGGASLNVEKYYSIYNQL